MANVLAYAEARGGELRKVALETVTAARQLADALGGEVHALLVGPPGVAAKAAALGEHGADVVFVSEHEGFGRHAADAITATAADVVGRGGYRAVLFGASIHGRDLAPRVAARADGALVTDAIELAAKGEGEGETLVVRHPVYTGKVTATLEVTGSPAVVSLRPNVFTPASSPREPRVEQVAPAADPGAERARVTGMSAGSGAKLDLGEAPVVVSGGRGLRGPENFRLVEELAAAFGNAAVGCTRAVADDGWRPQSDQIGQTGRVVSPELYVAVGISGAIQHIAGMRTAKTIVAINKDAEAPIFKVADYGIVGDALEIVPKLTEAVKEARKSG